MTTESSPLILPDHREDSFTFMDGYSYLEALRRNGWTALWIEAAYHWVAIDIKGCRILSFTEGDVSIETYDTEKRFLEGLIDLKKWWVWLLDKHANMCLAGCGEKYGFLKGDQINLDGVKEK